MEALLLQLGSACPGKVHAASVCVCAGQNIVVAAVVDQRSLEPVCSTDQAQLYEIEGCRLVLCRFTAQIVLTLCGMLISIVQYEWCDRVIVFAGVCAPPSGYLKVMPFWGSLWPNLVQVIAH